MWNLLNTIYKWSVNVEQKPSVESIFDKNEQDSLSINEYLIHVINSNFSWYTAQPIVYDLERYIKLKEYLDRLKLRFNSQKEIDFISSITDIFKLSVNDLVKRDAGSFLVRKLRDNESLDSIIDDWYKRIEQY